MDGARFLQGTAEGIRGMDYHIKPAGRTCAVSGRAFRPGEWCWSVLLEKSGELVRQDICEEAWAGVPEGAIGYWRCPAGGVAESLRPKLTADAMFQTFLQLYESPNRVQQQYRYILTLLLLRKRRLILEEVVEQDEGPVMRLSGSAGEGPFEIPEEELSETEMLRLQQQLMGGEQIAA
ncbi:MAG: hypothetical protein ACKO2P_08475 [Planctomycetota bacterium]